MMRVVFEIWCVLVWSCCHTYYIYKYIYIYIYYMFLFPPRSFEACRFWEIWYVFVWSCCHTLYICMCTRIYIYIYSELAPARLRFVVLEKFDMYLFGLVATHMIYIYICIHIYIYIYSLFWSLSFLRNLICIWLVLLPHILYIYIHKHTHIYIQIYIYCLLALLRFVDLEKFDMWLLGLNATPIIFTCIYIYTYIYIYTRVVPSLFWCLSC